MSRVWLCGYVWEYIKTTRTVYLYVAYSTCERTCQAGVRQACGWCLTADALHTCENLGTEFRGLQLRAEGHETLPVRYPFPQLASLQQVCVQRGALCASTHMQCACMHCRHPHAVCPHCLTPCHHCLTP